ncbi:hypothetical protein K402DRAFT_241249 [Aulographum hederae CBS 113979]|uniref:histidine kinase n=1 Tax=Aulographum hederae CBS 113979 TaxID=1176131 RepID=A0A6G1GKA0_9PEZI|nr:hypothetical protein K402DRAFT_241249 [Aulographum hederae CBS 113979]
MKKVPSSPTEKPSAAKSNDSAPPDLPASRRTHLPTRPAAVLPSPLAQSQHTDDEETEEEASKSSLDETRASTDESGEEADDGSRAEDVMEGEVGGDATKDTGRARSEALRVQKLREAVLQSQSHQRLVSRGPPSVGSIGSRRISPIKEETPAISPTLNDSFSSPLATGAQTASTESTESTKTIRGGGFGSVPATPGQQPIRTPSYPFPYIPGTPRGWAHGFHQPFTNLSPTVSSMNVKDTTFAPRDKTMSGPSTPADSIGTFVPGAGSPHGSQSGQYPTPNLYDMVLLLNSEPGLEAWWAAVVKIMHEWYGAERVSLAVPADANELESVPWGQKATFNVAGPAEPRKEKVVSGGSGSGSSGRSGPLRSVYDENRSSPRSSNARPHLSTRHSYAGYEAEGRDEPIPMNRPPSRPKGPLRTASLAPHLMPHGDKPVWPHLGTPAIGSNPPPHPLRRQVTNTFSDPDFSNSGEDLPPHETVFSGLQALDGEKDALIDSSGVNKVLERGRVVTLTRDYTSDTSQSRRQSTWGAIPGSTDASSDSEGGATDSSQSSKARPTAKRRDASINRLDKNANLSADYSTKSGSNPYEEYEQYPNSPWAQSPAPSPAIQADPSDNPFFTSSSVDEESFNPTETNQDYAHFDQVEAIGVDKASTVTHVPLIHPLLSQVMYNSASDTMQSPRKSSVVSSSPFDEGQKKAPIAILSFLSATVPFPQNLTSSLRLLGPHLATTFSNAQHYSNAYRLATSLRNRRSAGPRRVGFVNVPSEAGSLDDLLHLDVDDIAESTTGSLTSPSEYSAHSRPSPGNSLVGTPGWDPSAIGFSTRQSGTPGHIAAGDSIDSYFDAKRTSLTRSASSQAVAQKYTGKSSPGLEHHRPPSMRAAAFTPLTEEADTPTPKNEPKPPKHLVVRDEKSATGQRREPSPTRTEAVSPRRYGPKAPYPTEQPDKAHSQLHSYGADLGSSFQLLPATTAAMPRTPGSIHTHIRSRSASEQDMLPPSEKLLRVIIDSLPVQIFMAAPNSGALTWVNSKFLVYRGQESRQILQDPWKNIHPAEQSDHWEMWNRSLRTGQQYSQKLRIQRFDGQYRWFYVRVAPLKDKRQNIVHWIGTNMDFHEQHIAEVNAARQQETAASEAKYRALANSSPQIVFAVTRARGVTFCNSQWLKYSGQTEEQTRGLGFMDYVHPDDLGKCRLPTFDDNGTPVDVPTSLPSEPQLKRTSSESHTSSDDSSDTSATVMSPGGSTVPSTHHLPQVKLSKLASTGILKVSRDADGRPSYSTEVRLRSKDGNYRWHLVRVLLSTSVHNDDDEEETWYGTCTDINDHKLLEQTLKETMDAKSRFLSNMSHEIRTPLNGITGMVNFLIDSNLSGEQMEHVNIIRNSTEGLRDLINDILDLSKVEAGMITLSMDWMHVRSLIEEVNDLTSAMAIDKGLELNYVVDPSVPSQVKGDRFRIRQVLLNVIGNAIKFTQKGEVFVRCQATKDRDISTSKLETLLLFEVVDTGSGFTEKEAEFLFKRFSQIDGSSTRQHGGTGLGLAISMQLVELHGGKMKATSLPGKGSTFTFSVMFGLPCDEDKPPMPAVTPGLTQILPPAPPQPLPAPSALRHASTPGAAEVLSPKSKEIAESPLSYLTSPESGHQSPAASSVSSNPSSRTGRTSIRSDRSSASSLAIDSSQSPMSLELPKRGEERAESNDSADTVKPPSKLSQTSTIGNMAPPIFSILVVCPLQYSREATVQHLEMTLPKSIPQHITARGSLEECRQMLGGDDPVIFTHLVLVLHETSEVVAFMDQILGSTVHKATSLVIISDLVQKRDIMKTAPRYNYDQLTKDRRVRFVFKPLKPSKLAVIFDPGKEREMSTDRNQDSAQQVAVSQKQLYDELKKRFGDKGVRVLLVEDNKTNQMVLLKFLGKVAIETESVLDGVQCTDKVFAQPHGYYSIILCDLHMPNKDGYQTCKDIRRWERKHKYPHLPIIALSANVLGDVYSKCVEAGFNSYVTKPVDFKELSVVMTRFLDPEIPGQAPEFMRPKPE